MPRVLLTLLPLMLLGACSSIIEGTSQEIFVNTTPGGANCGLEREGLIIARVNPTPAATTIQKTKHDITIVCNLDGYHETRYFNKSDVAGATFGNIILGGGIGWAIDSASGADNKYMSPVNIALVPLSEPKPDLIIPNANEQAGEDGEDAEGPRYKGAGSLD